jgi:hypothetical protein
MQVFRTVMITCILIIWPLVTFEIYFCNSGILHKRTYILIKLHIRSYFYKYIHPHTFQHMHYISYLLWYNLTPRVSQRPRARALLEFGDDPSGWTPPVSERKEEKGEKGGLHGRGRLGKGWAARGKRGRKEGREEGRLGRAVRERGKAGSGQAAREKWERKKKKKSGPGPTRK